MTKQTKHKISKAIKATVTVSLGFGLAYVIGYSRGMEKSCTLASEISDYMDYLLEKTTGMKPEDIAFFDWFQSYIRTHGYSKEQIERLTDILEVTSVDEIFKIADEMGLETRHF